MAPVRDHLRALLLLAQGHHHSAEQRLPKHDWSLWYAAYIDARLRDKPEKYAVEVADAFVRVQVDSIKGDPVR
jgi:hypothetical protein